ncbi:MAG: hypothetical protein AAGU76_01875 [Sedimentibacter sp.]|uniref:hypothetical protein n=1 Tax=Sedimentibacter sp. TaxID=1960295 RepID=UPI0031593D42
MNINKDFTEVVKAVQDSISHSKCRKCGCMKKSLQSMESALMGAYCDDCSLLLDEIQTAISKTEPTEYT